MGYALFTARKMSLQAKVNQYNLKLMQIENEKNKITEQTSRLQQKNNRIDAGQQTGAKTASIGGRILGAVAGFALGGVAGVGIGSSLGGAVGDTFGDGANKVVDGIQEVNTQAQQRALAAKDQQLDTERQRLNTLLTAAQAELKTVEEQETKAIESSSPKYMA